MASRRNFLKSAGVTGLTAATCQPMDLLADADGQSAIRFNGAGARYLQKRKEILKTDPKIFLGYPINLNLPPAGYSQWRDELFRTEIGSRANNNAGDPYHSRSAYSSHYLEADVIDTFAARFGFDNSDAWGFISHSGTDSNMHGAYIGRTLLKQKSGVTPKVYYTRETHYSIEIIRDLLAMQEVLVDTSDDGAMDVADLQEKLKQNRDAPALVLATVGTTFRGAIDDIDAIQEALRSYESYVHLDAALFGGYLQASEFVNDLAASGPAGKRYDSISVSCHKFFGLPMTAGIFVTRNSSFQKFREYFSQVHNPAYISHVPGTITTSRNPLAPALFHYFSTEKAFKVQQADAIRVLENARYLHKEMRNHFPELEPKIANDKSNIVHFNKVNDRIKRKWTLATIETGVGESLTHAVVMPHATKHYLDMFLSDLEEYKA